jgi:tetratricopeptide (TPR) repeat protein
MPAVLMLTTLLLCACGGSDPSPADLVPANLSRLDPNVIALVEQQITRIMAHPLDGASYAELGMIYEANMLWADARRAYAAAVELEPASTWWRFHLAVATRTAGDLEGALRLLRDLALEHAELAPIQQRLGEALTETGDLAGAAAAYRHVIDLKPGLPEGYHGLGEVKILERDYAAARELLERAVALDPRYRASRYALGLAYRGLGLFEEAQREMARGIDAVPRYLTDPLAPQIHEYAVNLPARRNRAAALLHGGRPDQAALLLEQVLNEQPDNATDLNNLAIAYMRMGRFEEAKSTLDEARRIAPNLAESVFTGHPNRRFRRRIGLRRNSRSACAGNGSDSRGARYGRGGTGASRADGSLVGASAAPRRTRSTDTRNAGRSLCATRTAGSRRGTLPKRTRIAAGLADRGP